MPKHKKNYITTRYNKPWCVFSFFVLSLQLVCLPSYAALSCFNDSFNRAELGSKWAIKYTGDKPIINGQRLRLTGHANKMRSAVSYTDFLSSNGIITVEFDLAVDTHDDSADGMTVTFSNANTPVQLGGDRGSLGYAPIGWLPGFPGGWLGVGIDDWGDFSSPTEGRSGGPGQRRHSVAIRASQARNYQYIRGTNGLLNWPLSNGGTKKNGFKVTLDSRVAGKTVVTVARDAYDGKGYQIVVYSSDVRDINEAPPSRYRITFTATNGGFWAEPTFIDNVKICHDPTPAVHHFELSYSANPLTCQKESVTVFACANASCTTVLTNTITATLASSNTSNASWENSGKVTLTSGIGSLGLRGHNTSPVTLSISSPAYSLNPVQCRRGGGSASSSNCTFSFADSGFLINAPDKLAGKSSHTSIQAVRKSNSALNCVPALTNVTKQVKFWSGYGSPSSPVNYNGSQPQITLGGNAIGRSESTATTLPLGFDSQGRAFTTLNYPDAGKVSLHAKYNPPSSASDGWLNLSGSDSFVSVPQGLCVTSPTVCPAANGTCPKLVKSGDTFPLTMTAKAWVSDSDTDLCDNPTTPNYQQNNITLGQILKSPSGGVNGTVGVASYNHTINAAQSVTVNQSSSEVGVFEFTANPPARYLGSTASFSDIPQTKSKPIGRFIPAEFAISNMSHQPACGAGISGFSYMGQPYKLGFKVSARNTDHDLTRNYVSSATAANNFAYSTLSLVAENANDGSNLSSRLSSVPIPNWVNGEAVISGYQVSFSRPSAPTVPSPLGNLSTGIIVNDIDGAAKIFSPDMNPSQAGDCIAASNCTAKKLGVQQLLFGRLMMDNAFGPETETISMPLRAEYWNGSWQINRLDNCTTAGSDSSQFNPALTSTVTHTDAGYIYAPALTTGQSVTRTGSGRMNLGEFSLRWQSTATGGAALYKGKITAPLRVPPWLRYYWNWDDSSPNANTNPRASVRFGGFRGNDKSSMWKEL